MFFIRPARRQRNLIYNKFYQKMPSLFIYKIEHHNLWKEYENRNFQVNGSFYNVYSNLPKISFIHKISKNKGYTGNEHLLCTQNGNFQEKSTIL